MIVRRASLATARPVPWANGRGMTRELLREDGPDGGMMLRLSVADVVEPGPFSPLPGVDRLLTLIEGPGFVLSIDGRPLVVRPLEPVGFAGEADVAATTVPAPSRDFNVMTERARLRAAMTVFRAGFALPPHTRFLFVVEGAFRLDAASLGPGDLVEVRPASEATDLVEGAGALLAIAVQDA
jgi:environmental stress-induced protein Ves